MQDEKRQKTEDNATFVAPKKHLRVDSTEDRDDNNNNNNNGTVT